MKAKKPTPRNKFELKVKRQLVRAKAKFQYEPIRIPYVLAHHYTPDFVIDTKHGKIYIECKGFFRREHKSKMKAVKKQHPEMDIRIVFYEYKKANVRWAERNDFKYAIGKIPKEWLDE